MNANTQKLVDQVRAARRVSTPLIAIATPDPAATIDAVLTIVTGDVARVVWDVVSGLRGRDDASKAIVASIVGETDSTIQNPLGACTLANKLPPKSILFIHFARHWLADPSVVQAIWLLRDRFKIDGRTLVLLSPSIDLPPELQGDVLVFDEPLPDAGQLRAIVVAEHENAGVKPVEAVVTRAVEAVQGLPAFQAEQVVAMSLSKSGLDVPALWERKRRQIELTPGLKMMPREQTFDSIGGLLQVKQYLVDLMNGQRRPNAITWLDEIDKALPGNNNDSSGVSQDQLGVILSYMEDNEVLGVLLLGPPGSGKSAIAKAAGNTVGIPTVRFDLGACKGSLVGESEGRIRGALRVISSISNDRALFVATANAVGSLDSALKRRFPFIFYFDLPSREEKDAVWRIWMNRYELKAQKRPEDGGWSAANIQKCCECAWRLGRSLIECARYVVACERVSSREIEALRKQADGVFLSASDEGVFRIEREPVAVNHRRRAILEDRT